MVGRSPSEAPGVFSLRQKAQMRRPAKKNSLLPKNSSARFREQTNPYQNERPQRKKESLTIATEVHRHNVLGSGHSKKQERKDASAILSFKKTRPRSTLKRTPSPGFGPGC